MSGRFNHTSHSFILLGLAESPGMQLPLFGVFLLMYVLTLMGNVGMVALVGIDQGLHTPMYFFLRHFSLVDACYSTTIVPNMLASLASGNRGISFAGCVAQLYSFLLFGITECYLLAIMACDRCAAICRPLHYVVMLPKAVCVQLVSMAYVLGVLYSVIYTSCTFGGSFGKSNIIDHFFCDISPLLKLSGSDKFIREKVIFACVGINGISTSGVIVVSYLYILSTILKMPSVQSRSRAFNTCASHLLVVSLFYRTGFFTYLLPSPSHRRLDKVVSMFYTMVTPLLNPLIYSLRNREVKEAWMRHAKRFLRLR